MPEKTTEELREYLGQYKPDRTVLHGGVGGMQYVGRALVEADTGPVPGVVILARFGNGSPKSYITWAIPVEDWHERQTAGLTVPWPAAVGPGELDRIATLFKGTVTPAPSSGWQHYNGGVYFVDTVAVHSRTHQLVVVYQSRETGLSWMRPRSNFLGTASTPDGDVPRFSPYVEPEDEDLPGAPSDTIDVEVPDPVPTEVPDPAPASMTWAEFGSSVREILRIVRDVVRPPAPGDLGPYEPAPGPHVDHTGLECDVIGVTGWQSMNFDDGNGRVVVYRYPGGKLETMTLARWNSLVPVRGRAVRRFTPKA